jgi:hypothetical protein
VFRSAGCNICCHFPLCNCSQRGLNDLFSCHPLLNPFDPSMLFNSFTLDCMCKNGAGAASAKTSEHIGDEQDQ